MQRGAGAAARCIERQLPQIQHAAPALFRTSYPRTAMKLWRQSN